ncbi:MAG: Bor/Iss family lipoprotein [Longimicrobiales bacterium]
MRTVWIGCFAFLSMTLLSSCFHATVETGLPPSPVTVEDDWADAWISGLVSPETVDLEGECPNGVSRVETQLTFTNQLVSFLTLGIYTPMQIVVTCAAP